VTFKPTALGPARGVLTVSLRGAGAGAGARRAPAPLASDWAPPGAAPAGDGGAAADASHGGGALLELPLAVWGTAVATAGDVATAAAVAAAAARGAPPQLTLGGDGAGAPRATPADFRRTADLAALSAGHPTPRAPAPAPAAPPLRVEGAAMGADAPSQLSAAVAPGAALLARASAEVPAHGTALAVAAGTGTLPRAAAHVRARRVRPRA
jgi:hypothetical protein